MKKSTIASLIIFPILAIGTFCLCFFLQGNYEMIGWANALFFSSIFVLGGGLLTVLGYFGAFDFVVYGFRSVFKHFSPNYRNACDQYPDYYAYMEGKKVKRREVGLFVWPWAVLGTLLMVSSIVLYAIVG
ncbi:MAG: DUF3899 domain-containing protein [Candidatus Enteromonas sp.]